MPESQANHSGSGEYRQMDTASAQPSTHEQFLTRFLAIQPSLRSYVQALVGPESDCDDLIQEISLVLWREFPHYDSQRPFIAWAIGIARNQVARYRRDHAIRRRRFSDQAEAALGVAFIELEDEFRERRSALRTCLGRLGPKAHELLRMRYQQGMDLAAIAHEQASTVNAINKSLGKIRRLLLECTGRAQVLS